MYYHSTRINDWHPPQLYLYVLSLLINKSSSLSTTTSIIISFSSYHTYCMMGGRWKRRYLIPPVFDLPHNLFVLLCFNCHTIHTYHLFSRLPPTTQSTVHYSRWMYKNVTGRSWLYNDCTIKWMTVADSIMPVPYSMWLYMTVVDSVMNVHHIRWLYMSVNDCSWPYNVRYSHYRGNYSLPHLWTVTSIMYSHNRVNYSHYRVIYRQSHLCTITCSHYRVNYTHLL